MILDFKKFLQTSIPPLIYVLYAKGYHDFSVEKISSHISEKFRRGNRLCLRKFRVSKNFMPKRGISRFSIKNIVVPQYRKYFVGEPCFISENFWYRKNLWIRGGRGGGSITIFRQKMSLTVPKNFVGETFSVSLISGIERFYASEIYLTILCRNFFCLSAEKFRRGTFLICVSEKIWYRKKNYG